MSSKLIAFGLILTASLGLNLYFITDKSKDNKNIEKWHKEHRLISENIGKSQGDIDNPAVLQYADLKPQLETIISGLEQSRKIGIFVQDISTGGWLGINEKEEFVPASLFKIPIAMAILKKSERGEIDLRNALDLTADKISSESSDLSQQPVGTKLTYLELLRKLVMHSDNTAKNMLLGKLSNEEINSIFAHIGLQNPYLNNNIIYVSPRDYTRIFKSLYYSTFLTPEDSEKILDLATDTTFEALISSGVPPEVQVTHKFGICNNCLHDCGIVYHPQNPYFICVMTKDIDLMTAKNLINKISYATYKFVDSK